MTYDVHTPQPDRYPTGPTQPAPDSRMPGIGAAAAVLGFVEAGAGLTLVAYVLFTLATFGGVGDDIAGGVIVLVGTIVLSGLLLLGSLFLARRSGRRLLIGATIAEIVLVLGFGVWALVDSSSVYTSYDDYAYPPGDFGYTTSSGPGTAVVVALLAVLLVAVALPVVRLALVSQPAVGTWLRTRPPAEPVWSSETQQWVTPRARAGVVLALLAPVALLLIATIVVLTTAEDPFDYAVADGPAGVYGSDSEWSDLYDGGDPVEPPTSDDPLYEAQHDADAQDCHDGDLGACDDLYTLTEVGSLYEWLGSTCGGREEFETYGSCE